MDTLKQRSRTKVVAIVDLVVTCLVLCVLFLVFMFLFTVTVGASAFSLDSGRSSSTSLNDFIGMRGIGNHQITEISDDSDIDDTDRQKTEATAVIWVFVTICWLLFLTAVVLQAFQLFAAIRLLNSTQIGIDPIEAIRNAKFWRNITATFLVLAMFNLLIGRGNLLTLIAICFRVGGICIVQAFIKELKLLPQAMPVYFNVSGSNGGIVGGCVVYQHRDDMGMGLYPDLHEQGGHGFVAMMPSAPPPYRETSTAMG